MEIMLLGSDQRDCDAVETKLIHAGHNVYRCNPTMDAPSEVAICIGETDAALCPLNAPLDVAVIVESGPAVIGLEPIGVGCSVRDQVPLAKIRPDEDPHAAVSAVLEARDINWADALNSVMSRDDLRCSSERRGTTLHVEVSGNIANEPAEIARVSSRAYDVVRDRVQTGIKSIGVGVHPVNR